MPNELIVDKIARALLVKSYELDDMTEWLDDDIPRRYHELAAAVLEVLRPMMWQDIESAPISREYLSFSKAGVITLNEGTSALPDTLACYDKGSEWILLPQLPEFIIWGGTLLRLHEYAKARPLPDPPTLQTGER